MKQFSTYCVKIQSLNHIFEQTAKIYRHAVEFFLNVILLEWEQIEPINGNLLRQSFVQGITVRNKNHLNPKYPFEDAHKTFYKMPVYLRRAAITEALGKASSYQSALKNWQNADPTLRGKEPSIPSVGVVYPALYRDNMFKQTGEYTAQVKIFKNNTWDWQTVSLRKSDMDYIKRHCQFRKHCVPILQKKGKYWRLAFSFEETLQLNNTPTKQEIILAVDLGINTPATVSVMKADGTILGRYFCHLPKEQDSLVHAINRIKKAQKKKNHKTPRLWNRVNGINHDISSKTARFIMEIAYQYQADVIVFEYLDFQGKKRSSKKQRLSLWRKREVQEIVTQKAHRASMRIRRVNAKDTSRLAFDGSGKVLRGKNGGFKTNTMCKFSNGKIYNCDLSASYNIGARYFIRELLKPLSEKARLQLEANVPEVCKRSTCTFSTLISLNAKLGSLAA